MTEEAHRLAIVTAGQMLSDAGLAPSTSGNLSVRFPGGVLVTPTNSRLANLSAEDIALLTIDGSQVSGLRASKEAQLHLDVYGARPDAGAIVHLHSPYCTAVSCLSDLDAENVLPPLTPYSLMRFGAVGLVPFFPPGSSELAKAVNSAAANHRALLLGNHGSLVAGRTLESACADAEELEHAAQVYLLLRDKPVALIPARYRDELIAGRAQRNPA
jgi:3-dehydro-4-phosphotetronate decarboxylase